MRNIRISDEVWNEIANQGKFGETEDDVLRRIFKLPEVSNVRSGGSGDFAHVPRIRREYKRSPNKTTCPLSARVEGGRLLVEFHNGKAENWDLPPKVDKRTIRNVRDQAVEFAKMNDATKGQQYAVMKALTDAGYHLTK